MRVVLADDHQMFVEAIRLILTQEPKVEVLAVADNGDDLLATIEEFAPDVALVDVTMKGPGAQKIAEAVKGSETATRLIALTMHLDHGFAELLLQSGFSGYVLKEDAVADLLSAILAVRAGGTFLSETLQEVGGEHVAHGRILTKRETTCLNAAADGLSNKLIAANLGVSERTIKFHFENILRKLSAVSRGEAVAKARRYRLL